MTEPLADLYRQLHGPIFRFLLHLTGEPDLAEELAQETFLQALLSMPGFRGESSVTTWLYGIARNVYRKRMVQEQRGRRLGPVLTPVVAPTEAVEVAEQRAVLARAMATLPDPYREALILREYQSMSYAQVAHLLGQTETWARVTCYRARQLLRDAYLKEERGKAP